MLATQLPCVELCRTIQEYDGADAYDDVLKHWLATNRNQSGWLAEFQRRTNDDWAAATHEDLCRLYALFRVTSTLLLGFQSCRAEVAGYQGPAISIEGFQRFHEQLGFHVAGITEYHPFYHEIVSVNQTRDHETPIRLCECAWPGLMLGDMMFCRAGCTVDGGSAHVVKDIAESSKLYWTYRRIDRPYNDLSHGWGHNSQWRTAQRRDYRSTDHYHFNVDGRISLNDADCSVDDVPVATMIELVRNRAVVRSKIDDSDLYPYDHTYTEAA